jgi:hypothetical protein
MLGTGECLRAKVNKNLYVEATVMAGTGSMVDAKIGHGIGSAIVVVDSWLPADGARNVDHQHSYTVNCHAATGVTEKTVLYDGGGDFAAGGTLTDTVEIGNGVQLAPDAASIDFDDYNSGRLDGVGGSPQPDTWFSPHANPWFFNVAASGSPQWDGQGVQADVGNAYNWVTLTDAGDIEQGVIEADWYWDSTYGSGFMGFCMNATGSGSALRGHVVGAQGSSMELRRINNEDSTTWVAGASIGFTPSSDTLYHLKVQFTASGGTTTYRFKFWADTGSEPASYTYIGQDTVYNGAGKVGYHIKGGASALRFRSDNFNVEQIPAAYKASGNWTGDPVDMTSLVNYSYAVVDWDETTPANTTAAVKARWRNGGTWLACTNGGEVPGIDTGANTGTGSAKDSVEFRIELATTDTGATPLVENLRFYHEPIANAALAVDIDGAVTCTEAAGTLDIWGKQQVSGGANVIGWDDVWLQTFEPYLPVHLQGGAMAIKLQYGGVDIDEIITTTVPYTYQLANEGMGWYWSFSPIKYASAPVEARWNAQAKWFPSGHVYEWVLIDYTLGMHADARYLVGHYQLDDQPGMFIGAALELADHQGSYLAEGYQRDDHQGSYLAQAWRADDQPGMYMPGVWALNDHVGFFVVAVRQLDDQPGSWLARGVNSDGVIETSIIDADAWATLVARGYTRG